MFCVYVCACVATKSYLIECGRMIVCSHFACMCDIILSFQVSFALTSILGFSFILFLFTCSLSLSFASVAFYYYDIIVITVLILIKQWHSSGVLCAFSVNVYLCVCICICGPQNCSYVCISGGVNVVVIDRTIAIRIWPENLASIHNVYLAKNFHAFFSFCCPLQFRFYFFIVFVHIHYTLSICIQFLSFRILFFQCTEWKLNK